MPFYNQNLSALRQMLGLTQQQMADALQVKRTTYIGYEEGTSKPQVDFLITLHENYGVDLNKFLTDMYDVSKLKFKAPKNIQKVSGNNNVVMNASTVNVGSISNDMEEVIQSLNKIAKQIKKQESKKSM